MIRFVVDEKANKSRADHPLHRWDGHNIPNSIARITKGGEPEAHGTNLPNTIPTHSNAFIEALTYSYAQHYPLVLAPDDVWIVISQSFAHHVDQNAEKLRHMFVQHEGKKELMWRNDSLIKGSPDNNWMDGFDFFAKEIQGHIGDRHDLLTANFSTTGPIERAASQVVLMDAMKHYFSYGVMTCCGVPEITLLGTPDDWRSIQTRARAFAEFEGLEKWCQTLDPILTEFVNASEGLVNQPFWRGIYKNESRGSGNPIVSGWANALFLYMQGRKGLKKNPLAENLEASYNPANDDYPSGLAKVPFTWYYHGTKLPYEFLGGFTCLSQDPETLALRPAIGWAVREEGGEPEAGQKKVLKERVPNSARGGGVLDLSGQKVMALPAGTVYRTSEPVFVGRFPVEPKMELVEWPEGFDINDTRVVEEEPGMMIFNPRALKKLGIDTTEE